jgi:hypothetical protein
MIVSTREESCARHLRTAGRVLILLLASGCMKGFGQIESSADDPPAGSPMAGRPGGQPGGPGGAGAPSDDGGGAGRGGATSVGGGLLPARIRRLTNAEIDASLAALFATTATPGRGFANDTRQSDFTANADQRVDPLFAAQVQAAARTLAPEAARTTLAALGCSTGMACAERFVSDLAGRAFRRPLGDDERQDLLAVFQAGTAEGTFSDGIALVAQAVLESASFLYVTELGGAPAPGGLTALAPFETASALAYLLTGGPPDRALMDAAAAGGLAAGSARRAQAERLLQQPMARRQVRRFVEEWLGLDHLQDTGKDQTAYPRFEELRPLMAAETAAFIETVAFDDDGTVARLLSADYTVVDPRLASFYGVNGAAAPARTPWGATARRGLLMQAGFLSVFGHAGESAPVRRGAVILKKLLCVPLPTPSELKLKVVPPMPDPGLTTRERFAIHSKDPACAACHAQLDPVGFALESFDGMGGFRATENGKPVDTKVVLAADGLEGAVNDGVGLMAKLAASDQLARCFASNLYRFAAAETDSAAEARFLTEVWQTLPPTRSLGLRDLLIAYTASDGFVTREVRP